jgi:hypothetical protein
MGGVGMAPRVDGGVCRAAALAPHAREGLLERRRRQGRRLGSGREQPGPGALALPVSAPQLEGPFGQGPLAVFAPWALVDPHQHALGVEVRDLEMGPFPETQATSLDHPQTPLGCRACDRGQQGADFLRTQHAGQCLAVPGPSEGEERPRALQGTRREEPDAIEVEAAGTLGDLLVIEQRQTGLAEVLFAEWVGSAPVVWRQVVDRGDRTRLGRGGEPAPRQVFEHTAAECRQGHPPVRVASDPSPTVDTNKPIDGSSPGGKKARKMMPRRDHSAAYRAAL